MLQDGIPIIYNGQEQHYSGAGVPNNREDLWRSAYSTSSTLYTYIKRINAIRAWALQKDTGYLTYKAYPVYSDQHTIAVRKGANSQVISVFTNSGASGKSYSITLTSSATGFTAKQSVTELLTCAVSTTDSNGNLAVTISGGLPKIYYLTSALSGYMLCSGSSSTLSTSATKTSSTSAKSSTVSTVVKALATSSVKSSTKASATTSASSSSCPSRVAVTFNELINTTYGETIKISGSVSQLGNWNTSNAVALSAAKYTASNPLWSGTISLPAGSVVQYKYINVSILATHFI
jgi:alpha-amylase